MHIVLIAWLYVIGTMALTSSSWAGGVVLFAGAGLAPALLWLWFAARRARARRDAVDRAAADGEAEGGAPSVREQRVGAGDDGDAKPDQ